MTLTPSARKGWAARPILRWWPPLPRPDGCWSRWTSDWVISAPARPRSCRDCRVAPNRPVRGRGQQGSQRPGCPYQCGWPDRSSIGPAARATANPPSLREHQVRKERTSSPEAAEMRAATDRVQSVRGRSARAALLYWECLRCPSLQTRRTGVAGVWLCCRQCGEVQRGWFALGRDKCDRGLHRRAADCQRCCTLVRFRIHHVWPGGSRGVPGYGIGASQGLVP